MQFKIEIQKTHPRRFVAIDVPGMKRTQRVPSLVTSSWAEGHILELGIGENENFPKDAKKFRLTLLDFCEELAMIQNWCMLPFFKYCIVTCM